MSGHDKREGMWSDSIVVGSNGFVENVRERLGFRAKGRTPVQQGDSYMLRESAAVYQPHFNAKKAPLRAENGFFWGDCADISMG